MTRLIITLGILAALIGIAFWEESYASGVYGKLEADMETLAAIMEHQDDEGIKSNTEMVNRMYDEWIKSEPTLSIISRHFDLVQVSDALIYVKNFVEFGNKEEAFAGIQRLRYLINAHKEQLSTGWVNII